MRSTSRTSRMVCPLATPPASEYRPPPRWPSPVSPSRVTEKAPGGLLSAGHVDRDAGDEVGVGRGQKADDPSLILRSGDPAERRALDLGGLALRGPRSPVRQQPLGQGEAGRDGIHCDS